MKTIKARDLKVGMWICRMHESGDLSPLKEVIYVRYIGNGSTVVVVIDSGYMYFDLLEDVGVKR